jgi:signal transduction histidine kinase/DNA-binding response OmpR family regulator
MELPVGENQPAVGDLGLDALWASALRLGALAAVPLIVGFLVLAAVELELRQRMDMWLVVLAIAGTGGLVYRLAEQESKLAAPVFVGGLLANVLLVLVLYPGTALIFALGLVSLAAGVFLTGAACVAVSGLTIALATLLTFGPAAAWPATDVGPLVFQIVASGLLAWLGQRPMRVALEWHWSSYLQAVEKTQALRTHRAELVRLSQQLTIAVNRLEETNHQLDRARREADAARRLKSEFATAISHELRTPLNLIIGFSDMLTREAGLNHRPLAPARLLGDVQAIHRNAVHISDLINDVLDLSRIEAHRFALQKQPIVIVRVVEEAVEAVRGLFDEAAIALRTSVEANLPVVLADPVRTRQVLINLLANAARHTEVGAVEVTAARDGNQIVVAVRDTGVGIPAEDLPWVFEEFRQVGDPRRRRGGSGLGLAVTRHFVEMHGGNIWVESAPGSGSTFTFTLPLQKQVVSIAAPPDWNRLLGGRPSATDRRRVLLIAEPETEPYRLFRSYLDGYEVVASCDLDDAERLAQLSDISALILTESRPQTELRRSIGGKPTLAALPVLTCALPSAIQFDPKMAVADYLVKPVRREALVASLRRIARRVHAVLIVDDDADFRELLARTIRQEFRHCRALQAADGATALDLMRAQPLDAVVLDLLMAGSDGYDVLTARIDDPALRAIPLVVVSARGAEDETITADSLTLWRTSGLTMGELMRCARAGLEAILMPADSSEPASPAGPAG